MRMINDMDRFYATAYVNAEKPMWMKEERIDFCDIALKEKKKGSFARLFGHKKTK